MKTAGLTGVILLVMALLAGSVYTVSRAADSQNPKGGHATIACDKQPTEQHTITIERSVVSPVHTEARSCDRLTIINRDDRSRLIAFGVHDSHRSYDGVQERVLSKNQQLAVTLNQKGEFIFHDHFDDAVQGTFTVR